MKPTKKKASKRRASKASGKKKTAKKKVAQKANRPEGWINQTGAAALCRVSVTMFQRYELEPVSREGRYTFYLRDQVLDFIERRAHKKGYEAGLREGKQIAPEDAEGLLLAKEQAELEWTRERAEGQRLKNAQTRREQAPVDILTFALADLAGQIAPLLMPIPAEMKRRIPKITNAELHVMREIIANAMNLCAEVKLDFDAYESDAEPASD